MVAKVGPTTVSVPGRTEHQPADSRWTDLRHSLAGPSGAAWVFGAMVAVSFVALLRLGDHYWFFRDDWVFLAERELTVEDLFDPHNAHWSTVPVFIFRVLYRVFGLRSYVPYQAVVIALHLGVVVMLRAVMRRAGVGPWLATAVAAVGLLLGSGREDIVWAFQIGFTGSMAFSLGQLLLADHDGPIGRRDVAALALGGVALMTASPAIALTVVIGLALLVRRGWQAAAIQTVPLGLAWFVWSQITHPDTGSPFGRPDLDVMVEWVWNGLLSTFLALVDHQAVAFAIVGLLVAGVVLAVFVAAPGDEPATWWQRLQRIATPLALFAAVGIFMVMSVQARWIAGSNAARASRYVYFYVMCSLPVLAVAAQALARRARLAGIALAALLLIGVPANVRRFDDPPFGPAYHAEREQILSNAPRMPFAREVDPELRPFPDPYMGEGVDMGFLLGAYDSGRLDPSGPIPLAVRDRLEVVLSLDQASPQGFPSGCDQREGGQRLRLTDGDELILQSDAQVRVVRDGRPADQWVMLRQGDGALVTAGRDIVVDLRGHGQRLRLCLVAD